MAASSRGFSLVEIVITLAVISFALVGIIGLFPTAMNAAKESRHETRSAAIAQMIFGQLRNHDPVKKAFPLGPDPTKPNTTDGNLNISLQSGQTNIGLVAFDEDGEPIQRLTDAQYTGDSVTGKLSPTAYKVRLRALPNQPYAGLARIIVEVTYPPGIPLANRSTNTFSLLLNNVSP